MRIILEGPDNSGKSRLAQHLSRELDYPMIHSPGPEISGTEMQVWADRTLSYPEILIDRICYVSEPIYSRVLDRMPKFEVGLEKFRQMDKTIIIYCRPPEHAILRDPSRREMPGVVDNHPQLVEEYDRFMLHLIKAGVIPVIIFDYHEDPDYIKLKAMLVEAGA